MAKCMLGPCAEKMAPLDDDSKTGGEKMALLCPLIDCFETE